MKRLFCWILTLVSLLVLAVSASGEVSSFDPSVFEDNDGFIRQDGSEAWTFFKGIVFNDVGGKDVQFSVQADGADTASVPRVRLFVLVNEPEENKVTEYGTPDSILLNLNGNTTIGLKLPDRYNNPACASLTFDDSGETLCGYLADVQSLSLEISFEGSDRKLSYELTDQNIDVFRRSIGKICSLLIGSGIFDELSGSADNSGLISIDLVSAEADVPAQAETPTPVPTETPTSVPTETPAPVPTETPSSAPSPTPAVIPEPAPAAPSGAEEQSASIPSFTGLKSGDTVLFGSYMQQAGSDSQRDPISWRVLTADKKKRRILLLAEKGLDILSFSEPKDTDAYLVSSRSWQDSYIRSWLNSEFYQESFSEDEKQRIQGTDLRTKDKTGSRHTTDKIFLLDSKEAKRYLKNPYAMACTLTDYASEKLQSLSGSLVDGYCRWWLRELVKVPQHSRNGVYIESTGNEAGFVNGNHGLKLFYQWIGCPIYRDDMCAVRPALWVNMD